MMMLSTGIPEMKSVEDIKYIPQSLSLGIADKEAGKYFAELIHKSLKTKATQLNFVFHLLAH